MLLHSQAILGRENSTIKRSEWIKTTTVNGLRINEFHRFLKIAKGSVGEVRNQLYLALTLDYIAL
ncbi:four helix bundle protein [Candidatus Gottesmanbacteria bacterium]|nr:four helix bundle protein [Candidatus Gottesmanbacteria bacterium]